MTISDGLVIAAMIIAPILAVQIQKFIESQKELKERKKQIFRTLMSTRATPLSPPHVEALNMIDIAFHKDKKIVNAWKLLLDNFDNYPNDPKDPNYQTKLNSSAEKSKELSTDLLFEMAKSLNYEFDKVHLKRGVYIPRGHADFELEQNFIRKSLIEVFSGRKSIPINIVSPAEQKEIKDTDKEKR